MRFHRVGRYNSFWKEQLQYIIWMHFLRTLIAIYLHYFKIRGRPIVPFDWNSNSFFVDIFSYLTVCQLIVASTVVGMDVMLINAVTTFNTNLLFFSKTLLGLITFDIKWWLGVLRKVRVASRSKIVLQSVSKIWDAEMAACSSPCLTKLTMNK